VGQAAAGWSGDLRSAWRCTALHCQSSRRYPWVTRSSSVGAGERPFARCSAELDGHRIGQVTAHLGDEKVPLVAAYVREPRSNEPKLFVTSSCGCTQSRARIAIPDEWWTRAGHSVLQELALIGSTECTDLEPWRFRAAHPARGVEDSQVCKNSTPRYFRGLPGLSLSNSNAVGPGVAGCLSNGSILA